MRAGISTGLQQRGIPCSHVLQTGTVGETQLPGDQVHGPGAAGLGEHQHRTDQRPVPKPCIDRIATPHQVEVLRSTIHQPGGHCPLARKAQSPVGRFEDMGLAVVETQPQAIATEQHEFPVHAREDGKLAACSISAIDRRQSQSTPGRHRHGSPASIPIRCASVRDDIPGRQSPSSLALARPCGKCNGAPACGVARRATAVAEPFQKAAAHAANPCGVGGDTSL